MPVRSVTEYLDQNKVDYHACNHAPAVTSLEVSQSSHIPAANLAKTVICNADGELVMAVLPAHQHVDCRVLQDLLQAETLRLAEESEFADRFPLCELGGMPPLGELYRMPVYMDESLLGADWIAFNAGTHTEVIKMDTGVFKHLVKPTLCNFAVTH